MRGFRVSGVAIVIACAGLVAVGASSAQAALPAGTPGSHSAVAGFASADGKVFSVAYADGSLRPNPHGDAFGLQLHSPITAAAAPPGGHGYYLTAADGGVFAYGSAPFWGSSTFRRLTVPVVGIVPWYRGGGGGYYQILADGRVYAFGNAFNPGGISGTKLAAPIVAASPNKKYFRMLGADGGVFTRGDATYHGSLPGIGVHVRDVVGMAPTPSGNGYWIARRTGQVYAFGDAQLVGSASSACDPVVAVVSNPVAQGYRLLRQSGASQAFGTAPGGNTSTAPRQCGQLRARIELPSTKVTTRSQTPAFLVVDNQTGRPVRLAVAGTCAPHWAIYLSNNSIPNQPFFPADCNPRPFVVPPGQTQLPTTMYANYAIRPQPCNAPCPGLPPGQYAAKLAFAGGGLTASPVSVTVTG